MTKQSNLRLKISILCLICFTGAVTLGGVTSYNFLQPVLQRSGERAIQGIVHRERERILLPMISEVRLAEAVANSSLIKAFLKDVNDTRLREASHFYLESQRTFFKNQSYFLASNAEKRYYYASENKENFDDHYVYDLSENNSDDSWYFRTIESDKNFKINVDFDRGIKKTNVWINVVVRDGREPLGIFGTGIDLSEFIRDIVATKSRDHFNILIDSEGAIQAHPEISLIDFASIRKNDNEKSTIFDQMIKPELSEKFKQIMMRAKNGDSQVEIIEPGFFNSSGFSGISYIEELDWFVLSVTKSDRFFDSAQMIIYFIFFVIIFIIFTFAIYIYLDKRILSRVRLLDTAIRDLEAKDYTIQAPELPEDELGRLGQAFNMMSKVVRRHINELETLVADRTADLQRANSELMRLSATDGLTGLATRRRLDEFLTDSCVRSSRSGLSFAFVLVDVDYFKEYNDTYGHLAGDECLRKVSNILSACVPRDSDLVARYGGEEFALVLIDIDKSLVKDFLEKILSNLIEQKIIHSRSNFGFLTLSMGFTHSDDFETPDPSGLIETADAALYMAKKAGRNQVREGGVSS